MERDFSADRAVHQTAFHEPHVTSNILGCAMSAPSVQVVDVEHLSELIKHPCAVPLHIPRQGLEAVGNM